jgi:hypothetical protein
MLGDFDACLRICLDNIHRNVAVGQAPESGDIRMMGRCLIRLCRLDDLKKHTTPQSGLMCSGMNCSPIFELVNALVVVTIFGANQSLY